MLSTLRTVLLISLLSPCQPSLGATSAS
jgi:hypothetical protein